LDRKKYQKFGGKRLKKLGFWADHGRKMKGQIYPTNSPFLCRDVPCNVPTSPPGRY